MIPIRFATALALELVAQTLHDQLLALQCRVPIPHQAVFIQRDDSRQMGLVQWLPFFVEEDFAHPAIALLPEAARNHTGPLVITSGHSSGEQRDLRRLVCDDVRHLLEHVRIRDEPDGARLA